MLIFCRVKSFFNCLSIYQVQLLFKLLGVFIIIISIIICQILGFAEIIPSVCAITSVEDSIDIPIPLQSINTEDSLSIQRSESNLYENFYEEIPEEEDDSDEVPTMLPGWSNKEAAKCTGLLIGILGGLAARTYFFVLIPNAGFNCEAWRNTNFYINDFLRNLF